MCLPALLARLATLVSLPMARPGPAPVMPMLPEQISFRQVVDLTHTLTPDFPTFDGGHALRLLELFSLEANSFRVYRWLVEEHSGTHIDAPWHFGAGLTVAEIALSDLVGPLAVVDIRARAAGDADTGLTPDDILGWEAQHGPLPAGGIVAMLSGWGEYVASPRFRNSDGNGRCHFPGFHAETVELLLRERDIKGIAVDTLSLDRGVDEQFPVHYAWLRANKWGLECVANLETLPPVGATLIAAAPKISQASGGPTRVMALV